jgi:two-component system NtrC family sensor kinase
MVNVREDARIQPSSDLEALQERIVELEARCAQAEEETQRLAQSLTAISEMAIELGAATPDTDSFQQIAASLKAATGAAAVGISSYDTQTQALTIQYLSASSQIMSKLDELLGHSVIGMRIPLIPDVHAQMLTEIVRRMEDLSEATYEVIPRPIAAILQKDLAIDHLISLSLHYDGELMGTALLLMSKGQASLPAGILRSSAHIAALFLRRRRTEEALRESEEQYRRLIETSPDGIILTDLNATILMVNREAIELFGCDSAEDLLGRNALELVAPKERPQAVEALQNFLETRVMKSNELELLRKDASLYLAEVNASLVVDTHDNPRAIVNVVRDVTDRKRMERAMQQRRRELELLNGAGQALNASLDLDQVLSTTLDRACDLMEVFACSVWLIDPETGDLVCRCATGPHTSVVEGWRVAPGEGVVGWVAQSGESLVVADMQAEERHFRDVEQQTGLMLRSAVSVPLRLKENVIGTLQVLDPEVGRFRPTDLMLVESLASSAAIALENARLYEDLQQRMKELREAQAQLVQSAKMAAVGELAAGVAHEINTPLTSVLGYSELLLEHLPSDDPNHKRLASIVRQAGQARDVVEHLLEFSRQTRPHREQVSLNRVVQETLVLARQQMKNRKIALEEEYALALPPLQLDAPRMKQAFLNLITNSLQAMPHGGTLGVRSEWVGNEVAVQITDTGSGIAADDLPRIFEPFFTTRPVGLGAGLGLSVSLGIVEEHGGRIEVESELGQGSTFTVWLPMRAAPVELA